MLNVDHGSIALGDSREEAKKFKVANFDLGG